MTSSVEPAKHQRTMTQSAISIRGKLNDQLNKLHTKHNAEIELLEDLKQFARQRSMLEKQYSEGLHRLVSQYTSKRDILPPPELPDFERHNNRGLMEVWRALLEKTEELSKRRLTMSELLTTQVSEVMKQQRRIKETNYKRLWNIIIELLLVFYTSFAQLYEICQKMNSEILESSKEMATSKKSYGELEKVCEDARTKFSEADTRLKKRDLKFFESMSTLEKNHGKASERLKSCQKRTACSRNDYMLAVEMLNAHLKCHATRDLPQIMQAMDGEMYNKVRNSYALYAQIEADTAQFIKAEFEDLAEQAYLVNREYVLECFLHTHPVLGEVQQSQFEPHGQDKVTGITRDHGAEIFLDKDARKWANKFTKDQMTIANLKKQVKGLQSVTSAYTKNPEFGTSDAQAEALQNIDSFLEEIRQLEVGITKAEARLEGLRQSGIDVNKWLQKAEKNHGQTEKSNSNELTPSTISHGRISQLSLPSSIGGSQDLDVETSSINSGQLGPYDNISIDSTKSENTIKYCICLYNYTAQRPDELNISKNEELEVIDWDDGDGWCKGKNKSGQDGYFPQSYVQQLSRPSSPSSSASTSVSHQVSVTSTTSTIGTANSLVSEVFVISPSPVQSLTQTNGTDKNKRLLKAVYEYTAQYNEELTFPEGAVIELLRTDENGVDDGWWEGSYQGKVGVFPSLVVEVINSESVSPDLNSTLIAEPLNFFHPPESPPPLPPGYPPPPVSSLSLNSTGVGPSATFVQDYSFEDCGTPVNFGNAPPSLHLGDQKEWKMDSFDEYDSDDDC